MRVVLDANVLVSAVISQAGPPREIVTAWVEERFELIASPALLDEVRDVLARPRLRRWVSTRIPCATSEHEITCPIMEVADEELHAMRSQRRAKR